MIWLPQKCYINCVRTTYTLPLYTVSQEEISVLWEVTVLVILAKTCMCTCTITNSFWHKSYFTVQEFRFGTQFCPSLPPYCAPLDFCLWGWMKSEVYRTKVDTWEELLDLIMYVIASIKEHQDALRQATCHVLTRVAKCIDVDVGIFEYVLY
jgi:hypothetical protein